jgi:hypothetical protein
MLPAREVLVWGDSSDGRRRDLDDVGEHVVGRLVEAGLSRLEEVVYGTADNDQVRDGSRGEPSLCQNKKSQLVVRKGCRGRLTVGGFTRRYSRSENL